MCVSRRLSRLSLPVGTVSTRDVTVGIMTAYLYPIDVQYYSTFLCRSMNVP